MNYILFDDQSWSNLLPLTYTCPVASVRCGILTLHKKWNLMLNATCSILTQNYLIEKYPVIIKHDNILVNSSILPNKGIVAEIKKLSENTALIKNNTLIAIRSNSDKLKSFTYTNFQNFNTIEYSGEIIKINYPWDIFRYNGQAIINDFELVTQGRKSAVISKTNNLINPQLIFAEEGAMLEYVTLNASGGPIYIGKDAEIMEGSVIRGPFAICQHATVKLASKIYGPTTIGPYSKIGGEVNNSVIFGYSNKAHDGFLGNSVIGKWCNLGADTNNSNLKNNYGNVSVWNYNENRSIDTGLQFCGLIMGDHSKCGINTMFNTGTVVGVNVNIYGSNFPPKHIPSFTWGDVGNFTTFSIHKAIEIAERVMSRRNIVLDEAEKKILLHIYEITQVYRNFSQKNK